MIVLKFGGTSVANAQNIQKVIAIVNQKAKDNKLAVVVSALSGVTDMLINASKKAASKDETYKTTIEEIKQKHFDAIADLVDAANQNQLLIKINSQINQLQTLLDGCFLLGELSPRTSDAEHFPSDTAALCVPQEASVACSTKIALEWDEAFKNMNDPSGRAVANVHDDAYVKA